MADRKEARSRIDAFFDREKFAAQEVIKIKKLAMKYNIRLGKYRARFCKKCYNDLTLGKTRISKTHKITECLKCGFINKVRIAPKN